MPKKSIKLKEIKVSPPVPNRVKKQKETFCERNGRFRIGDRHVLNRLIVEKLGLVPPYNDFMAFRELFISAGQDGIFETHMLTISKLNKVLKVNM
jgi:hypothetical protein